MMENSFFKDYYQELKIAFESGRPTVRYNSDRSHNAVIMCFLFDNSKGVNMYCGKMSVLRSGFFKKINENNKFEDPHLGDELKEYLIDSFKRFLERDESHLNILFETFSNDYLTDLVSPDSMRNAYVNNKISFRVLPASLHLRKALDHFTVSDSGIFRYEDDKELHSAICSFHDAVGSLQLEKNFAFLSSLGKEIPITIQ